MHPSHEVFKRTITCRDRVSVDIIRLSGVPMNRCHLIAFFLLLFCSCSTYTPEPVINKPTELDIGFIGDWTSEVEPEHAYSNVAVLSLSKHKSEANTYVAQITNNKSKPVSWDFLVATCGVNHDVNLIQITRERKPTPKYCYLYAKKENDKLVVWSIDTDKLIAKIKEQRINSVIDRRNSDTEIIANSSELLELLTNNFSEFSTARRELLRRK